jgi:outer membrane protein OmpA-like peptidoglycan-associated protein
MLRLWKQTIHKGGVKMQAITAKRILIVVIAVFSLSLMVGCSGMEKRPQYRSGYLYYPTALVNADRALDEARAAGKDKECPEEFNAAKDMVDKAYETYMACHTQEAIDMANKAIAEIKALCPAKPVAEMKPEPTPVPAPAPEATPPPPAPVVEPVKIVLEDIHFDFDKATLTEAATGILDSDIKTLKENPGIKVQIEGHTCSHGAEDYNMALGERRADAVKEYLENQGIAADRLTTISYGKTRPLCVEEPTPQNKNSKCMKENRRVHFEVIGE